jgi:phosphoglycerate dehydrogenase-like enzyme
VDCLILEPLQEDARQWLADRHSVRLAPELAADATALRRELYNVRTVVLPTEVAVTEQLLGFAPRLRALARLSVGIQNIDADACRRANVEVVRSLNAHAQACAEYMVTAILGLFRRGFSVMVRERDVAALPLGREVHGATIGLIGMSPTARVLAMLLKSFGARVIGYDPALHASDPSWAREGVEPVPMNQVMALSDAVCVQLTYASRYRGLISAHVLKHGKPGQVMVCIARHWLFDQDALAAELRSGRIEAAIFDSADQDIKAPGSPFHGLKNFFVTPQMSVRTREARSRATWYIVRRLDEILRLDNQRASDLTPTRPNALEASLPPR